jgi:hypothetical protein
MQVKASVKSCICTEKKTDEVGYRTESCHGIESNWKEKKNSRNTVVAMTPVN